MNVTLEDCIALSELTPDEVEAVAEHEHVPEIIAAELGNYLLHTPDGIPVLRKMIVDDIAAAREHGDVKKFCHLMHVLRHFMDTHPDRAKLKVG